MTDRIANRIFAVVFVVIFLGFPALATSALTSGPHPIPFMWSSYWTGVMTVLLVDVTGVYAWMLWTGRVVAPQEKGVNQP